MLLVSVDRQLLFYVDIVVLVSSAQLACIRGPRVSDRGWRRCSAPAGNAGSAVG
jgi:hypothetical protein